ncbi:MAG: hypothetical protein M1352_01985 [Patescibacteria group bacterium]|nr:hypothetical protein [Patescibacteria group bacterium]
MVDEIDLNSANGASAQGNLMPPVSAAGPDWQMESLFRAALARTKERFVSYFFAAILSLGLYLALALAALLSLIIIVIVSAVFKFWLITVLLLLVIVGILASVCFYVSAWANLSLTKVLIDPSKVKALDSYRQTRPLIWGFVWFLFLCSLFTVGLAPFGLFSLGIIFLLWGFWNSFSVFVYLEKGKRGLSVLWTGRALINRRFWPVAGRITLIYLAVYLVFLVVSLSRAGFLESLVYAALTFLVQPFLISFTYELYKNCETGVESKAPAFWLILSIVGWILLSVGIYFVISALLNLSKTFTLPELYNLYNPYKMPSELKNLDLGPYINQGSGSTTL